MAVLDFGPKRFSIALNGTSLDTGVHPPVTILNGIAGVVIDSPAPAATTPNFGLDTVTLTLNGTSVSLSNAPMRLNLGLFGSGRIYQSDYVGPGWKPTVVVF